MSKIAISDLAKYAVDQLEVGEDSAKVAQMIAAFLLEERRSRDHAAVMRAIDEELTKRGSAQVVITAAHEVSDATKKQLATLLDVQNPRFSEVIDESVIGGVKAVSGEKQIDLTVKSKLQRFNAAVMRSN